MTAPTADSEHPLPAERRTGLGLPNQIKVRAAREPANRNRWSRRPHRRRRSGHAARRQRYALVLPHTTSLAEAPRARGRFCRQATPRPEPQSSARMYRQPPAIVPDRSVRMRSHGSARTAFPLSNADALQRWKRTRSRPESLPFNFCSVPGLRPGRSCVQPAHRPFWLAAMRGENRAFHPRSSFLLFNREKILRC